MIKTLCSELTEAKPAADLNICEVNMTDIEIKHCGKVMNALCGKMDSDSSADELESDNEP